MRVLLLLLAILICSTNVHAANKVSSLILALDETKQRVYWTQFLQKSGEKCDAVVRIMYQGGGKTGIDDWSVGCRDGNAYQVGINPDAEGSTQLMGCAEMIAFDAILMKRVGKPPNKDVGCWIKY